MPLILRGQLFFRGVMRGLFSVSGYFQIKHQSQRHRENEAFLVDDLLPLAFKKILGPRSLTVQRRAFNSSQLLLHTIL